MWHIAFRGLENQFNLHVVFGGLENQYGDSSHRLWRSDWRINTGELFMKSWKIVGEGGNVCIYGGDRWVGRKDWEGWFI